MAQSLATRYSESTARTTQFGLVHWDDGAIAYDPQSASALDIALFASSAARVLGLEHSEQQLLISAALLLSVQQMRPPSAPAAGLKPEPSPVRSNARNVDEVRRRVALLRETGDRSPRLLRLVEQHRERLDGSGTPKGLTSADIDPLAMVLAACSEYRRLVSGSDAVSPSRALALLYLQHQQTLGRPAVEAVVAALTVYPPGTCVDLSDGTAGLVIRSDRNEKLRPTVMLLPEEGTDEEAHEIVDLQAQRTISVRRVLDGPEIDRARLQRIVPGSAWSAAPWPQAEVAAAAP
ncbi:MAG: HD domain-containing phosphohydrolase [Steroidobacteraceae bacterium]